MNSVEQQFFIGLEQRLWTAADKLRSALGASVNKYVVLGLFFLKYGVLGELRDTLLPKLLAGELSVEGLTEAVEAA
ncbi:type I restriction-modification system subunit M N-terminal domain-containing protein [Roseateles sp.]|uniref:type I restriction-modification system subunit M N-terminal domain-containing protein n=1 Tax=Roseateles sp. TaxID=1971397 RepID=UPI00286A229B|nr:type I restriction-modification system subunit M N-terminal domain-containing protein [Roseateles sp.]